MWTFIIHERDTSTWLHHLKMRKEICILLVSLISMVDISFIDMYIRPSKKIFFCLLWRTDQPKFLFIRNSNEEFYWLKLYFASFFGIKISFFFIFKKNTLPIRYLNMNKPVFLRVRPQHKFCMLCIGCEMYSQTCHKGHL